MARGKQAVRSANRRVDAVNSHVDRLTDQLGDAKAKAKRYEKDALRLPHALKEIESLRAQVEQATFVEVTRLREQLGWMTAERDEAIEGYARIQQQWEKVLDRLMDHLGRDAAGLEALNRLMEFMEGEDAPGVVGSGRSRRDVSTVRIMRARRQISHKTAERLERKMSNPTDPTDELDALDRIFTGTDAAGGSA